jgi:transposase
VIRVDAVWLAVEPLDLRIGLESALARVVGVFGAARPHHAYLFTNRRVNRIKVLVHDGFGLWLAVRRLHRGRFVWAAAGGGRLALTREQCCVAECVRIFTYFTFFVFYFNLI